MAVGDKQTAVRTETAQALGSGINQTPTLFINGIEYTGQTSVAAIGDAIVAAAGGATPSPAATQ